MDALIEMMSRYIHNTWMVLLELAPWLLFGCLIAGLLHVLIPPGAIKRQLGRPGLGAILKAALAGVPMPLCSCGVIPAAIGLRKDGASRGASVSFLVATPQTAIDSTFVSYSFLGWPFALFKLVSSFLTGLLAGLLADRFGGPAETGPAPEQSAAADTTEAHPYPTPGSKITGVWTYGIEELLYMIWGWVVVGVLVSAALTTFVPTNFFSDTPYASGFTGLLIALVISLPMYACSTASVPIAAGLVHAGLPAGAALVYLVAGPATNVATVGAIYRVFGARVIGIYLSVIIISSLLFGYLFGFLLDVTVLRIHDPVGHEHVSWWAAASAVAICALFARFIWRDFGRRWWAGTPAGDEAGLERLTLAVEGMSCKGCVNKVQQALQQRPNIRQADASLEAGRVQIAGTDLDEHAVREIIMAAGYDPGRRLD